MLDYYPYGKILREYVSGNSEKFLTTFHERDRETNLDYRGARYYDSDYGRFLSVDPLAADYAGWSPYNYVLGNPVMLVDLDGKAPVDNIVYLVALKGSEKFVDANKVAQFANKYFHNLGLKTEVRVYQGDPQLLKNIDKTDAIAVIGGSKNQVIDFTESNISDLVSDRFLEDGLKNQWTSVLTHKFSYT